MGEGLQRVGEGVMEETEMVVGRKYMIWLDLGRTLQEWVHLGE